MFRPKIKFLNWYSGGWNPRSTRHCGHQWPIVPVPDDYDNGEIGGMIGRGNQSTLRKPAPVPLCPPQTPHAVWMWTRAAAVGIQRLTYWAMAWPCFGLNVHLHVYSLLNFRTLLLTVMWFSFSCCYCLLLFWLCGLHFFFLFDFTKTPTTNDYDGWPAHSTTLPQQEHSRQPHVQTTMCNPHNQK
jgi:hypothetical protein